MRQVVHQVLQFSPVVTAQLLHIYVDLALMIRRLHTAVMLNPIYVLPLHKHVRLKLQNDFRLNHVGSYALSTGKHRPEVSVTLHQLI